MKKFFHFGLSELLVAILFTLLALVSVGLLYLFPAADAQDRSASTEEYAKLEENRTLETPIPTPKVQRSKMNSDSIIRSKDYVGPPIREAYKPVEKLKAGQSLDLNRADSTDLIKVPSIGPAFARRIVKYRNRLGGFYSILQLQEVYGMDRERFEEIRNYFRLQLAPSKIDLTQIHPDSIPRHPYLNYKQRAAMRRILARDGQIESWSQLLLLPDFAADDSLRLSPYFKIN